MRRKKFTTQLESSKIFNIVTFLAPSIEQVMSIFKICTKANVKILTSKCSIISESDDALLLMAGPVPFKGFAVLLTLGQLVTELGIMVDPLEEVRDFGD